MTLIKYNPNYRSALPGSFKNLFDTFFYDSMEDSSVDRFLPGANVLEHEKQYEVQLAVPGMNKNDFNIDLEDGKLLISGERRFDVDENVEIHRREIRFGSFERVFHLPEDADQNKISASYQDGILKINIQKDEKKTLKHKIAVK